MDRTSCPGRGKHGTADAAASRGCTCPDALEAKRIMRKRCREHRQPAGWICAAGTSRRLQALGALGWPAVTLARELGASQQHISWLRVAHADARRVHRDSAAAVRALYERLSGTPGPSDTTRARAKAAGWAPPHAWDDDTIDAPDARPDFGVARYGGGIVAKIDLADVEHLEAFGYSTDQIAARLGVAPASIAQAQRRADARTAVA